MRDSVVECDGHAKHAVNPVEAAYSLTAQAEQLSEPAMPLCLNPASQVQVYCLVESNVVEFGGQGVHAVNPLAPAYSSTGQGAHLASPIPVWRVS